MAWLPRRAWIRRRYGHYGGRARTFRRSFYYRPWFTRRRSRRYTRRGRLRSGRYRVRKRWMTVRQTNPLVRRRCVIRGWMPVLWCDKVSPFCRPMLITGQYTRDMSGGWTLHELSLGNFYSEHLSHRNLWSQTNCGFDLARYHGTSITFWPHQTCDYIVWWDSDYGDIAEYKKLVSNVHPAILINRKHARLVLSVTTTRTFRPIRIFIKPPSRAKNEWKTMKEWAKFPLGLFAVSVIDFRFPWIHPDYTIYTPIGGGKEGWTIDKEMYDIESGTSHKLVVRKAHGEQSKLESLWWNYGSSSGTKPATAWVDEWPAWVGKDGSNQPLTRDNFIAVALGPFVKKDQSAECQLIATYRSKWTWGGDVLTRDETVCNPETYEPKSRARGIINDPRWYIEPSDIRKDGFIKPEVYRRLTTAPTRKTRFSHYPGEETSSEEEDQEIGALPFEESEEDDPGPSHSGRTRRGMDRGRIEELVRLRYLLTHIMRNKRSYSV
nr:MAG: ORF1 [Giant panda anellovirus]